MTTLVIPTNEDDESERNGNRNDSERNSVVAARRSEVEPITLLTEMARPAKATRDEQASEQPWRINGQGDLILSESLSTELTTLGVTALNLTTDESQLPDQSTTVARFAAEDKQLDAFQHALHFAYRGISSEAGELKFKVKTGRYTYAPGISYPAVAILMPDWRHDTELQRYLAYHLLRGMLRRYGGLPFPDRVDVRELGFGGGRLLVAYGTDRDEAGEDGYGGETVRVRRRIIQEMLLREAPITGP